MKKYEYVTVKSTKLIGANFEKYRAVIDEYALLNFKYIGYIPTQIAEDGKVYTVDLIFEKDI